VVWDTLVDADLANNTMGWQWSAGCGADAAPYFRIFNPVIQGERFDPDGDYAAPLGTGAGEGVEAVDTQAVGSSCVAAFQELSTADRRAWRGAKNVRWRRYGCPLLLPGRSLKTLG